MGRRVHIAHKYDVDFHEMDDIDIDNFLYHMDQLLAAGSNIIEWHDEENEMAWELSREAINDAVSAADTDEDMRGFLEKLLAQSNPDLDFMRIEFY